MNRYAQDGVNIAQGDDVSSFAARICQNTWTHSKFVRIQDHADGHFRGPRTFTFQGLPADTTIDIAPDGIGTKVGLIVASHNTFFAGWDVLAMTCGDITRWGGLPLVFSSVLDVSTLGESDSTTRITICKLFRGLEIAARKLGVVLFKGETAELGAYVGSDDPQAEAKFNWAGFAIGAHSPQRLISGDTLQPGQILVALRENGFRSNGLSAVRKAFSLRYGSEWYRESRAMSDIYDAALPSTLYDPLLTSVNGWHNMSFKPVLKMHLITHITGGGIPSKLAEDVLFSRGLSAELTNLFEPPAIMQKCANWRDMSEEECYRVWNGGQGMLVAVDEIDVDQFLNLARSFGVMAQVCGRITQESKPVLSITSKFHGGQVLTYRPTKP